jgi:hypothetical protein
MTPPAFSARKKNKDYMLLLVSHLPFQEDVAKIRSKMDIQKPFDMDSEEAAEWEQKWTYAKAAAFIRAVRKLIAKYGLPENFSEHVRSHIIYGSVTAPLNNFSVVPFSNDTNPSESRHVIVHIFAKLAQKEEKDLKRELNRLAKNLPSFKPLKDIEKKLDNEMKMRDIREYNKKKDREYKATYGEAVGKKSAKQAREHARELADHRKKRFGKK